MGEEKKRSEKKRRAVAALDSCTLEMTHQGGTQCRRPLERPGQNRPKKKRFLSGYHIPQLLIFGSSATGARATGSDFFAGGEVWLGKLVVDNVGELVGCDWARGGVAPVPEDCVCASFALRLV
jgi:hypothetical protein